MALSTRRWASLVALALLSPRALPAQYEGRSFTVTPSVAKATVGDTVRLRFRLVTHERDLLTDTVPRPAGELPEGLHVLAVEKLRRGADRVFTGEALVAFYRPGVREVPAFALPWVQIVTGRRGTMATEPATVEIVPVLPAGNSSLRDIREVEPSPGPGPVPLFVTGAALALLAVALLRRRRRPAQLAHAPPPPPPAETADPYDIALGALGRIERDGLPERGEVELHYQLVTDTLRDYLEAAEGIPARERTSSELLWALPPRLTEAGLRRLSGQLLGEADLVKFARRRPDPAAAGAHLHEARELLRRWAAARVGAGRTEMADDAVR